MGARSLLGKVHSNPSLPSARSMKKSSILLPLLSLFGLSLIGGIGVAIFVRPSSESETVETVTQTPPPPPPLPDNGRPQLSPLPNPQEVWECEVVVVGGSLGGVAAASHAMQAGAKTCLVELTPWLGGQVSSQGVSAIDESRAMRKLQNFSPSWQQFKALISQQQIALPEWVGLPSPQPVSRLNSCWVGRLCFFPEAGAAAAEQLLVSSQENSPESRWATSTAFKGAEFDRSGENISAVYAVRRTPRDENYGPTGRLSQELGQWYSWSPDATFSKTPIKMQAPEGKQLFVIDATDTGELIGWADIPHRLGSESRDTTGEINAGDRDNPDCTQAFTYPFAIAIRDDGGKSLAQFPEINSGFSLKEHQAEFEMEGFPVFSGQSFFHYRRILSTTGNSAMWGTPARGDITLVNWNRGNDWTWMNPPLILTSDRLDDSGQRENWLGGMSVLALKQAEDHALLFARWVLETQSRSDFPLSYLSGADAPLGTISGLSMVPYIREGRRILGREAYGQEEFMMREADLRTDMEGGRDFSSTQVALAHYDIDIHGCRYRNWEPSGEAKSAPASEGVVRPVLIPLEALIPQGVDNLLIGGKSIAVTHIVNGLTRVHYGEWSVGAAAGATAGWLVAEEPELELGAIASGEMMSQLQAYLLAQDLRLAW